MKRHLAIGLTFIAAFVAGPKALQAIVIDTGQMKSRSAVEGCQQLQSKSVTEAVAKEIVQTIADLGWQEKAVLLAPRGETLDWPQRVALANQFGGEIFLSLQVEFSPSEQTHGLRLYTLLPQVDIDSAPMLRSLQGRADDLASLQTVALEHFAASQRLATHMAKILSEELPHVPLRKLQGLYLPLLGVRAPTLMIGLGFLSNPQECIYLKGREYHKNLAAAIVQALEPFVKTKKGRG